jgi:hypothetical protein
VSSAALMCSFLYLCHVLVLFLELDLLDVFRGFSACLDRRKLSSSDSFSGCFYEMFDFRSCFRVRMLPYISPCCWFLSDGERELCLCVKFHISFTVCGSI